MAEFAEAYVDSYYRIESVARVANGVLRVLALADPNVRAAVKGHHRNVQALFAGSSARDYDLWLDRVILEGKLLHSTCRRRNLSVAIPFDNCDDPASPGMHTTSLRLVEIAPLRKTSSPSIGKIPP